MSSFLKNGFLVAIFASAATIGHAGCLHADATSARNTALSSVDEERADYDLSLTMLREKSGRGDAVAQLALGNIYSGVDEVQDYAEALKWYRRSADHGSSIGQAALGIMYEEGRGIDRDTGEALKWYRRSAAQGNPGAAFLIESLTKGPALAAASPKPPAVTINISFQ